MMGKQKETKQWQRQIATQATSPAAASPHDNMSPSQSEPANELKP
jgi:hypothetical protein